MLVPALTSLTEPSRQMLRMIGARVAITCILRYLVNIMKDKAVVAMHQLSEDITDVEKFGTIKSLRVCLLNNKDGVV